jgi:hypothetical protein
MLRRTEVGAIAKSGVKSVERVLRIGITVGEDVWCVEVEVGDKRLSATRFLFFPFRVPLDRLSLPQTTMVQAESSSSAARNGVKASTAGAPADYELPWSVFSSPFWVGQL